MVLPDPRLMLYNLMLGSSAGGRGTGIQFTADDGDTVLAPGVVVPNLHNTASVFQPTNQNAWLCDVRKHPYSQEIDDKGNLIWGGPNPLVVVGPWRMGTSKPFVGGIWNEVHATVEIRVLCRDNTTNPRGYTLNGWNTRDKIVESIRAIITANRLNPDGVGTFIFMMVTDPGRDMDVATGNPILRTSIQVEVIWLEGPPLLMVNWNLISSRPFMVVSLNGPTDGGDFGPNTPGTTTSGIQEAINAVSSAGGGTVFIKRGTYAVTWAAGPNIIKHLPNVDVIGEEEYSTIIQCAANPMNLVDLWDFGAVSAANQSNFRLENLTIDPNGFANCADACDMSMATAYHISNLIIRNAILKAGSIYCINGNFQDIRCENVTLAGSATQSGSCIDAQIVRGIFIGCKANNNTLKAGFYNNGSQDVTYIGCSTDSCRNGWGGESTSQNIDGLYLYGCEATNFLNGGVVWGDTSNTGNKFQNLHVIGGKFISAVALTYAVNVGGTFNTNYKVRFVGATLSGASGAVFFGSAYAVANDIQFINCSGYNPQGFTAAVTPVVPGTGVDATNTNPFPVNVYISSVGGGVSAYGVTDFLGNLKSFTNALFVGQVITVESGGKIRLTYGGAAPTWVWEGL